MTSGSPSPERVDPPDLEPRAAAVVPCCRVFRLEGLTSMPVGRLIGNAGLSLLLTMSTCCWTLSGSPLRRRGE